MRKIAIGLAGILSAVFVLAGPVSAAELLIPVGQVIGLELKESRVTIAGFDQALGDAARAAGLKEGDQIAAIDGITIRSTEDVRKALQSSDGDVDISIVRDSLTKEVEMEPAITGDGPKLGVFLRQGITGVGTVTYYDPDTGMFGALGHPVSDKNGEQCIEVHKGGSGDREKIRYVCASEALNLLRRHLLENYS